MTTKHQPFKQCKYMQPMLVSKILYTYIYIRIYKFIYIDTVLYVYYRATEPCKQVIFGLTLLTTLWYIVMNQWIHSQITTVSQPHGEATSGALARFCFSNRLPHRHVFVKAISVTGLQTPGSLWPASQVLASISGPFSLVLSICLHNTQI